MNQLLQRLCKAVFFLIIFLSGHCLRAEELYLEPVVQGAVVEESIAVDISHGLTYLEWEALVSILQIKEDYAPERISFQFMGQKHEFFLDKLPENVWKKIGGHIYFERFFLEQKLNVTFQINRLDMQLDIDAEQKLPLTRRLESQTLRQNLRPRQEYDSFANYQFDNRKLSMPVADLTLQHNFNVRDFRGDHETRTNYSFYQLDTGMLAGGLDVYASFFGDSENKNYHPRARITAGRTFLNEPKNAFNLVNFEMGDVTGYNSTLFNNSANGRGILASSFKDLVLSADKTIDLSGPLSAGWEVELYLDDQLIAFRQAGINGRYSFPDIPVNYGLNRFKLVFYGPYGEIQTEERNFYSGTSPVKKGEFGYTFNAYQKDHYLFEKNEPWLNPTNKPTIDFTGYYGLNDETTLISGLSQTYNQSTYDLQTFGTAGIQHIYGGASLQYNTLFDFSNAKIGHHFDIQGDVKIGTVFARYDHYGTMEVPAAYYHDEFMKNIAEMRLSGNLPYLYIPYYVSYIERNSQDNDKYQELHTRLSPNFMRYYNLSIENILSRTPQGNIDYVLLLLQAQYGRLGLHSLVRTNVSPESYVQSLNQQIDYRWDKNTYFQFNWDHDYRSKYSDLSDIDTFSLSAGRIFDFGGLNLGMSYDTDNNMAVMLTYNLSFGKIPGEKRFFTDAENKMSKQAAIYTKLVDENEQPVKNTKIQISGLQEPLVTNKHGDVLITDIEPYQKTILTLDTDSIEDLALVPEFEERKLVLRPGTIYPLTIKCSHRGGLEGYLRGQPELSSYRVVLTDKKGTSTTKSPEEDGSFIFENMVFGEYALEVINPKGITVYRQHVDVKEAFQTLAEAINL